MLAYPPNYSLFLSQFHILWKYLMEAMQLDLNAPILSVRRIAENSQQSTRAVGRHSVIPFRWEQSPGRPKAKERTNKNVEEEDASADAVDTPWCSGGSESDCSSGTDYGLCSGSFSKDPEVHDFLMERFLTAAKAMATGPLKTAPPIPRESHSFRERRLPVSLPYQHRPISIDKLAYHQQHKRREARADDDDDEEGYGGSSRSHSSGLIPRFLLRASFLLSNPVPRMNGRSKLLSHCAEIEVSDPCSPAQSDDDDDDEYNEPLWDAVHKHKAGFNDNPLRDDASKLTSESNQLTCWSDSQTVDESSNYQDSPQSSPAHDGKSSLMMRSRRVVSFDSYKRLRESYSESRTSSCGDKYDEPSSMRPSTDTAVSGDLMETPTSVDVTVADNGSSFEGMSCGEEENRTGHALGLLAPLLPKSPSESWLQRTLPSASARNPPSPSLLLGIDQVQQCRKRAPWAASSNDFNWVSSRHSLKSQPQAPQLTRFSDG